MRKHILLALIIASLVLAACSAVPAATPTPAAPAPTEAAPAAEETAPPASELSLTTQPWQWHGFSGAAEQFTVETPANYQVTFNADGTVNIVADCNNAAGSYTAQDGALTITIGPMTMAACPPASRSVCHKLSPTLAACACRRWRLVAPMPRFGALTMRSRRCVSSGFTRMVR